MMMMTGLVMSALEQAKIHLEARGSSSSLPQFEFLFPITFADHLIGSNLENYR
jgi:hypothetical protein